MWAAIGDLVGKVEQRHPAKLARDWIAYLDISSVDRESKRIIAVQRVLAQSAPSRARQVVCADDILVSTVRPNLNAVASVPGYLDGQIASTGFCVLRPNPALVCPRYLFYYAQTETFVSHLSRVSTGASYPAVTDSDVLEMPVPLLHLSEQKRIAGLLAQADRLRRTRRYALELSDTFLPAAFIKLFGDPIRNLKHWTSIQLGHACERLTVGFVGPMVNEYCDSGIPFLRSLNVRRNVIDLSELRFVSETFHAKLSKSALRPGDVVSVRTGKPGVSAVIPDSMPESNCADLIVITVGGKLVPSFLAEMLNQRLGDTDHISGTTGAIQTHFNIERARELVIPLPPIGIQEHFAEVVRRHQRLRANQCEALRQADHMFRSLLHRAFSETS